MTPLTYEQKAIEAVDRHMPFVWEQTDGQNWLCFRAGVMKGRVFELGTGSYAAYAPARERITWCSSLGRAQEAVETKLAEVKLCVKCQQPAPENPLLCRKCQRENSQLIVDLARDIAERDWKLPRVSSVRGPARPTMNPNNKPDGEAA